MLNLDAKFRISFIFPRRKGTKEKENRDINVCKEILYLSREFTHDLKINKTRIE